MKQLVDQLEELWCRAMHSNVMWPFGSHYRCVVCLREYPVPFLAVAAEKRAEPREEIFPQAVALRRA